MVMGDDSCASGRGFESQHCILDGRDIFTLIYCKNCIVCLKRPKINKKVAGVGPFKKKLGRKWGIDCGSGGSAVVYDTKGPKFKSGHGQ